MKLSRKSSVGAIPTAEILRDAQQETGKLQSEPRWRRWHRESGANLDTEPEMEHQMVYLKFLSAACAIGATLAIGVALRTKATHLDSRGKAVEALNASRLLH